MTTPLAPYTGLSQDDFLTGIQGLLPRGQAWPRAQTAVQTAFWRAVAGSAKRLNDVLSNFFGQELDPNETVAYLGTWFALLGLPANGWATQAQQNALLVWRLQDRGGFSDSRYIAMAATLGLTITCAHPAAYTLVIHAAAALTQPQRDTLQALVTPRNRATVALSFVYDL